MKSILNLIKTSKSKDVTSLDTSQTFPGLVAMFYKSCMFYKIVPQNSKSYFLYL